MYIVHCGTGPLSAIVLPALQNYQHKLYCLHLNPSSACQYCTTCTAALSAEIVLSSSQPDQRMPILHCLHHSTISICQYCTACTAELSAYANFELPASQHYQDIPIPDFLHRMYIVKLDYLHSRTISVCKYCTACTATISSYANTTLPAPKHYQCMSILCCPPRRISFLSYDKTLLFINQRSSYEWIVDSVKASNSNHLSEIRNVSRD